MIDWKQALEIAKTRRGNIDHCIEFEDAYSFFNKEDRNFVAGVSRTPVIVSKEDGSVINILDYDAGEIVQEFDVDG